jgi:hypothetical protein
VFGEVLYDLAADPREEHDLAPQKQDAVASFRSLAKQLGYELRDAFLIGFGPSAEPISGRATLSSPVKACDMVRMGTWISDHGPALDWVDLKFGRAEGEPVPWDKLDTSDSKDVLFRAGRVTLDGKTWLGSGANGLFLRPETNAQLTLALDGALAGKLPASSALDQLKSVTFEDVRRLGQDHVLLGKITLFTFPVARSGKPPALTSKQNEELRGTGYGAGK